MNSTSGFDPDDILDYPEEEIPGDKEYRKISRHPRKPSIRSLYPKFPIIIGIAIIFLFIIFLMAEKDDPDEAMSPVLTEIENLKNSIKDLAAKINTLDKQLSDSEKSNKTISNRASQLENNIKEMEKSMSSISEKLRELGEIEKAAVSDVQKQSLYVVKQGDTLYGIATRSGMSVDELRKKNGIEKNDTIYPGMKLSIK